MSRTEKEMSISQVISKRRENVSINEGYKSLFLQIIVIGVIAYLMFTQVLLITQAKGNGMFPAVKDGDLVIGYRLQQEYAKDDVIVYTQDGKLNVGRIVARETDVVTLDESGTLLVNGTAQGGEIIYPSYAKEGIEYPYRVPENSVFVMGDFRTQTVDSRDFGAVSMENVEGKVITLLRRRGL